MTRISFLAGAGALALAFGLAGSIAVAADAPPPPAAADNHDTTRAEAEAEAGASFDRLDANHDGTLTRDEMRAGRPDWRHGAGPQPAGDMPPPPPPPSVGTDAPAAPPHHWDGGEGSPRHGGFMAGMIFHRADASHSGSVSRAAFVSTALAMFDEADTNHDSVLTQTEREAARAKMRDEMRSHWQHMRGANAPDGGMPEGGPGGPDMPPPGE